MHPHLLLHVFRLCRFAGISGQYPLVQNVTVTEGGTANLTCRVEFNDNTSLQWSNPAQQTLFFGDKKGELEMEQTPATTWQIWSLKVYVGFAEECIKWDWILFFLLLLLLLVGDWPKKNKKSYFFCVSVSAVSASVPHFSSLCFHVCAARSFTVRRNRYTCVPAAFHDVFCKASLCGCIVCRCYYSFTLLLFILTHMDRHTYPAKKKPSMVRVDVTSSILNSITSADYHLPFAV